MVRRFNARLDCSLEVENGATIARSKETDKRIRDEKSLVRSEAELLV